MAVPVAVVVELFYSGVWNAVSSKVYARDPLGIRRGIANEGSNRSDPADVTLTINNRDGQFSPRNPSSPLYGLIGRNTPIRITANTNIRFVGEVASWPQKWDQSGTDIWVEVEASGIMRRLNQGQKAAATSALGTFIASTDYERAWPGLTAADVGGTQPMSLASAPSVQFGAADMGTESAGINIPTTNVVRDANGSMTNGYIAANVLSVGGTSLTVIGGAFKADTLGVLSIASTDYGIAINTEYEMKLDGVNGVINLIRRVTTSGVGVVVTALATSAVLSTLSDGDRHTFEFLCATSGSDVGVEARIDNVSAVSAIAVGSSLQGVEQVKVGYEPAVGTSSAVGLSWLVCWTDANVPDLGDYADAGLGHLNETAGRRIERLCSENSITFASSGDLDATMPMGPQGTGNLLDLMTEAAVTDGGFLYETRTALGLTYRTRSDLYDQATTATLDYSLNVFGSPPNPVDDDQQTRNDVTATNPGGGSARAVLTSGALSTAAPPSGVNPYPTSVSVNAATDALLMPIAGWALALGTIDEARYPELTLDMMNPHVSGSAPITAAIIALDVTKKLVITNPPAWLAPDDVNELVLGYSETIWQYGWVIAPNCAPASPYDTAVFASSAGSTNDKFDAENSATNATSTTTATSIVVKSAAGTQLWTTSAGEMPFDVNIAGERIRVTAISGASSPQTFTVTRSINGVVKTHAANEPVHLWHPARFAL